MAEVRALKAGNWSDTTVWSTGALPASGDDVYANNFAVVINQTVNIGAGGINTRAGTTAVAGGSFTISTAYDFKGYITAGTATCLTISAGIGTVNIIGNITGTNTTSGIIGVNRTGSAIVNITGDIAAISGASNCHGFNNNNSTGTCTITGNLSASVGGAGVYNSLSGTIVVNGNIIGGSGSLAYGLNNASNGICNINGNVTGGGGKDGVYNSSTGTINITGNATGGAVSGVSGANNASTGTLTITGNATGGAVSGASGANNTSTGTLTITGNATGGAVSGATGANNASTGTLTVTTATASTTVNVLAAGVNGAVQGGTTSVKNIVFGSAGQTPISGFIKFDNGTDNTATVLKQNGSTVALSDPLNIANNVPSPANVRSGIVYNNNTQTGTLIVPLPSNVANGVPTDNTVGTAILSGTDFWHHLTSNITASSSIGLQMKNNIDATVSSRLATASYTAANNSDITAIKAKTDTLVNTDLTGIDADLITINTGVQKASLLIPHTTNL